MKKLILLCLAASVYAWDCSWVEKRSNYPDEELCRRAAVYEATDKMDKLRLLGAKGFSEYDSDTKSKVSSAMLENAEQCYQTCLKKITKG